MTSARSVLRGAAALVLAALLIGPSAHAGTSSSPDPAGLPAAPAHGHVGNEWLMMGTHCGASSTG
jgi:hypothetical protein